MRCPRLSDLPAPPESRCGWPWTEQMPPAAPDLEWPRVSIVMPCFNSARFIEEALRSVLLQGYPDLELIVIDGGSRDGTVEIIRRYERWISFWISEPDRGQSHAINKGLARSTGRFFNWHNADDALAPGALQAAARALVEHPQASYVHGRMLRMDEQSRILPDADPDKPSAPEGFFPDAASALASLWGGHQPGGLMDRQLVIRCGMIDERLRYAMDVDILLKLALVRPPYRLACPLVHFRVHGGSKTCRYDPRQDQERFIIIASLFDGGLVPPQMRRLKRLCLAEAHRFIRQRALQNGRRWRAWRHDLIRALYLRQTDWATWRPIIGELAHLVLPRFLWPAAWRERHG